MLVFTPFALCFIILRGTFMRFLELTYWQDATVPVPCFLLFLCFWKATQEIFSELDETSSRSLIFPRRRMRTKREPEGGPGAALTPGSHGLGPGRTPYVWGDPGCPLTMPLRLYKALGRKTPGESAKFPEQFRSAAAVEAKFRGTEVSIPAPCRDGEVPPEPSPSVSIAVTAISIKLAVSYDEEGVVLPRGWGLYR
jgi:hypothetical protein